MVTNNDLLLVHFCTLLNKYGVECNKLLHLFDLRALNIGVRSECVTSKYFTNTCPTVYQKWSI